MSFTAYYNIGVTEGLTPPNGDQELRDNLKVMEERLAANLSQIEAANVLEGIVVDSRQEALGSLCITGPEEKINQLDTFLKERKIGVVVHNTTGLTAS